MQKGDEGEKLDKRHCLAYDEPFAMSQMRQQTKIL
jgi:hypothetical protein